MITEDYVSFEIAKLLKEKEFPVKEVQTWYCEFDGYPDKSIVTNKQYPQITLQMAMKWLREVHKIFINVSNEVSLTDDITYQFFVCTKEKSILHRGEDIKTFEDACNEAIKFALENLI